MPRGDGARERTGEPAAAERRADQAVRPAGIEMPLVDGLRFESDAFIETVRSDDASRLMRAYLASERPLDQQ